MAVAVHCEARLSSIERVIGKSASNTQPVHSGEPEVVVFDERDDVELEVVREVEELLVIDVNIDELVEEVLESEETEEMMELDLALILVELRPELDPEAVESAVVVDMLELASEET